MLKKWSSDDQQTLPELLNNVINKLHQYSWKIWWSTFGATNLKSVNTSCMHILYVWWPSITKPSNIINLPILLCWWWWCGAQPSSLVPANISGYTGYWKQCTCNKKSNSYYLFHLWSYIRFRFIKLPGSKFLMVTYCNIHFQEKHTTPEWACLLVDDSKDAIAQIMPIVAPSLW